MGKHNYRPLRLFGVAFALLTVAALAPAQNLYKPQVGDIFEVYHHNFGPAKYEAGKAAMLRTMPRIFSGDGLVRFSIAAGNPRTGEIVIVSVADAFNVSRWKILPDMKAIVDMETRRPTKEEGLIFAINDEGATLRRGDLVVVYRQSVKPDDHKSMVELFKTKLIRQLRSDKQARNAYFGETDRPGEFVSFAYGSNAFKNNFRFKSDFNQYSAQGGRVLTADSYEIFLIQRERAR